MDIDWDELFQLPIEEIKTRLKAELIIEANKKTLNVTPEYQNGFAAGFTLAAEFYESIIGQLQKSREKGK